MPVGVTTRHEDSQLDGVRVAPILVVTEKVTLCGLLPTESTPWPEPAPFG